MAAAEAGQQKRAEENDELTIKDGDTDICQQLMDRYAKSSAAQHGHLVATAAAMRSILVAESLPSTPPAYFAAAISSADSTVNSPATDPVAVSALLTFLSIVVPLVPSGEISTEKAREAVTVLVSLIDRDEEKLGVASLRGGVKCIGTLLIGFCNLDDWESLDLGFASLLKFAVDKRPKVRRCAQECLEKILGSLQSSTVIKEASNTVYASFKEYKPVLAELSSSRIDEGSKVDLSLKTQNAEAVYVLNVLGVAIPFISSKLRSRAFSELCNLMASQFSLLTRQILKAMEVFFANSRDEISVPEIESIITSLTGYLSSHDKNPSDTVVQATILLRSALEKLHLVDSKLCLKKLPLVFGDLAGLLTSNDDTASQALDVLKDLINRHVDKDIVEGCLPFEGEENVADGNKIGATKSVCAVFESILDSCDAIPNERILDVTAILIDKLGELSYVLMRNIVLKLASLMTSATGDACSLKHLQHCIGSAVVAMGPEKILELLPISICADNRSCTNSWLIPILKRYIVGASLGYYIEHIVPLSKSILQTSRKAHRKKLQACSHELMELLPAFCNYPVDVAQNFGSLAKLLVKFINKYPFMNEAITLSLQRLVNQNKSKLRPKINPGEAKTCPGEDNTSELESENRYSKKTSTKNIKALASCSAELLQSLVDMFTGLGTEVSSDFKVNFLHIFCNFKLYN
ncbi:PREDICTED: RRP12-like protein [Tarenaya hassleriana]|uniref:RRP12-like protein n=1 Tax=Tarenaya hassleriana TaxID=28532 RepID=UPI00053C8A97|nr:PREDICTED: RRP12-like protein [Tarenaya hassleriana]